MVNRKRVQKRKNDDGYSLLEILVVLAIMGILISLVAPRLLGNIDKSKVVAAKSQIKSLELALDSYKLDTGSYPTESQGFSALMKAPEGVERSWYGPYLDSDMPTDPWGFDFIYEGPKIGTNGQSYKPKIMSLGADNQPGGDGLDADIES